MNNKISCGIDASTSCTGICIFENDELIYYKAIIPKGDNWRDRLFQEGAEISKILQKYSPEIIYMEDVPLKASGGLKTLVILGGVQGFIYGIAASCGIPVEFISPTTWRSKAGLFDGTKEGKKREVLKQKAIKMANNKFGLSLEWHGANSKFSQDDIAESILICATMLGIVEKEKKFGKSQSQSKKARECD